MSPPLVAFLALLVAFTLHRIIIRLRSSPSRNLQNLPYFPGPTPKPIIGNLLDLPTSKEWVKAKEWADVYGPRVFIQPLPGLAEPLLFLNSYTDVVELMEKRSAIYSSRPTSVMMCELQSWDWLASNMPTGPAHRAHRTYLHKVLQPSEVGRYAGVQKAYITMMLGKMLHVAAEDEKNGISTGRKRRGGEEFAALLRWMTAATIMRIAYGQSVESIDDHFVQLAERGIELLGEAAVPGKWLVDIFPWMKYIPEWFPGASFQRVAREGRELALRMKFEPYELAKKEVLAGTARPSMIRSFIEANLNEDGTVRDESTVAGVVGIAYVGGADTSVSTMLSFFLAMVLHPSIQHKAQVELDTVIGKGRLPTIDDVGDFEVEDADDDDEKGQGSSRPRTSLRYLRAIVLECLRWNPVSPLGAPHAVIQDDVYDGHFIPAKTMIIANVWAILHDPYMFPNPDAFDPERWLKASDVETEERPAPIHPLKVALGFGRRVCPGRYFAYNSIFLTIASVLSAFDILPALDEDGKPIPPKVEYVSSLISHPFPFPCRFVPRSEKAAELIRIAVGEAEAELRG